MSLKASEIQDLVRDILHRELEIQTDGNIRADCLGGRIVLSIPSLPPQVSPQNFQTTDAEDTVYHPLEIVLRQAGSSWYYWVYEGTVFNLIPSMDGTPIADTNVVERSVTQDLAIYLRLSKDVTVTGPPDYVDPYNFSVSAVDIIQETNLAWDPATGFTTTDPSVDAFSYQYIRLGTVYWNGGTPSVVNAITTSVAGARDGGPGNTYLYWPA